MGTLKDFELNMDRCLHHYFSRWQPNYRDQDRQAAVAAQQSETGIVGEGTSASQGIVDAVNPADQQTLQTHPPEVKELVPSRQAIQQKIGSSDSSTTGHILIGASSRVALTPGLSGNRVPSDNHRDLGLLGAKPIEIATEVDRNLSTDIIYQEAIRFEERAALVQSNPLLSDRFARLMKCLSPILRLCLKPFKTPKRHFRSKAN